MRHLPKNKYCGLTLVLSNPSRMDERMLLSGYAGVFINDRCLRPTYDRWQCDIRTADTKSQGILDSTRLIVLLGEGSFHAWCSSSYSGYSIGEQRGCKLENHGWPCEVICTFTPQDACDIVDYESRYNKILQDSEEDSGEEEEDTSGKRKGITKRANYAFWIQEDFSKIKQILQGNLLQAVGTSYSLYPDGDEVCEILRTTKGRSLFLDIETDANQNILCIGFGFDISSVFVVPILTYHYTPAYGNLGKIFQSFAIAMRDNEVICHNALFDLFILAWKYHIPVGHKIYDTMLAHHRLWPEIEKSLGHCMSHLTYEPYHKDQGIFQPQNEIQQRTLWQYNGRDVRGTILIKQKIDEIARQSPGYTESIDQVNRSIRPDLINTLFGIRFTEDGRTSLLRENDRLMTQYLRVIKLLVGRELLPTSNKQCVEYFHDQLGYKVVDRSKKTNVPSLGKDNIYKLKLQNPDNPVLDFTLAFRRLSKESGTLQFTPWMKAPDYESPTQ
jgi:hypothetical protein